MSDEFRVFDIETQIAEDTSGDFLKELNGGLEQEAIEVRTTINAGVAPDQYQSLTQYADAIDAAREVTTKLWKQSHN